MGEERITFCRERLEPSGEWCGKDAEMVVWGKLFPPEALGPRCYECAAKHIDGRTLADKNSAILDLRVLVARTRATTAESKLSRILEAAKKWDNEADEFRDRDDWLSADRISRCASDIHSILEGESS